MSNRLNTTKTIYFGLFFLSKTQRYETYKNKTSCRQVIGIRSLFT